MTEKAPVAGLFSGPLLATVVGMTGERGSFDTRGRKCEKMTSRQVGVGRVFRWLPLARQYPQSQRFSGPGGALEMPSNGDVLMMLLLTALPGKQPQNAPEIQFFSAPVDRETSVRR